MSAETDTPGGSQGAVSIGDAAAQQQPAPDPQPTPTVSHDQQTASRPAGSALPDGAAGARELLERPEVMVGAAFAGGILFASILKRLGR
jgi:hypothetical protein